MLRLLLLRHSKAAPNHGEGDFARPLTERGRMDALRVGGHIAALDRPPTASLHSGSARTRETLAIVLAQASTPAPARVDARIYEGSASAFLAALRDTPETACLLAVGHNPGIAELALRLAGQADPALKRAMATKYPTSALAILDLPATRWSDVVFGSGALVAFVTPASLGGEND